MSDMPSKIWAGPQSRSDPTYGGWTSSEEAKLKKDVEYTRTDLVEGYQWVDVEECVSDRQVFNRIIAQLNFLIAKNNQKPLSEDQVRVLKVVGNKLKKLSEEVSRESNGLLKEVEE